MLQQSALGGYRSVDEPSSKRCLLDRVGWSLTSRMFDRRKPRRPLEGYAKARDAGGVHNCTPPRLKELRKPAVAWPFRDTPKCDRPPRANFAPSTLFFLVPFSYLLTRGPALLCAMNQVKAFAPVRFSVTWDTCPEPSSPRPLQFAPSSIGLAIDGLRPRVRPILGPDLKSSVVGAPAPNLVSNTRRETLHCRGPRRKVATMARAPAPRSFET